MTYPQQASAKVILALFWTFTAAATALAAPVAERADIYVSPAGTDSNPGTREKPLLTLDAARDAARKLKSEGAAPAGGVTVWLHGGNYLFAHALELTAQDSGSAGAPITYRAVVGERPRLVNARKLAAADFRAVTDPAALTRIIEPARGKIVELDLAALGVQHIKTYPDLFTDSGSLVDLYFNGRRLPLARFPNDGFMTISRVLDTGGGPQGPDWRNPGPVKSPQADHGGTFEYREEFARRFEAWQKSLDRGVWLKGYWRVMWENQAVRIKSIDTQKHTVTLAKPVPGGIGNKYHRPQGNGQEQYWAMNLLEEVDAPGEWCVDFKDRKLYLYPPAPLENAEILLADSASPAIHMTGASHVVLQGLLIDAGLGDGIRVEGGEGNLVAGCTVRNIDKYGVVLNGGSHHTVQSCDLCDLGAGGIWLGGGDETSNPRVPAGHKALNNHIHHFAQIERVYAPAINAGFTGGGGGGHHAAVGMLVAHNLIHDTPHGGVLFGSWDSVFEYNEIFRYCTVSNDLGAFYSYDSYEHMGNQTFRYNFYHSSDDGDGIYFDHDHRDMHIYGNIAFLKSTGKRGTAYLYKFGTQARNPTSIECYNNIAMACNVGFQFVSATPARGRIENNVAVTCKVPMAWEDEKNGKEAVAKGPYPTGKNAVYDSDPGFVDAARFDFRLKPGSKLQHDLPDFQPIPMDKIGLQVDEYRRSLPSDDEIDRFSKRAPRSGIGYDVEDRK